MSLLAGVSKPQLSMVYFVVKAEALESESDRGQFYPGWLAKCVDETPATKEEPHKLFLVALETGGPTTLIQDGLGRRAVWITPDGSSRFYLFKIRQGENCCE